MARIAESEIERPKINDTVGIGNGKRKPIPIGNYEGIYWSEKYPNRDYALVRISHYVKVGDKRILKKLKLPYVLQSLVLIPVRCLKICESDKISTKIKRKGIGKNG